MATILKRRVVLRLSSGRYLRTGHGFGLQLGMFGALRITLPHGAYI